MMTSYERLENLMSGEGLNLSTLSKETEIPLTTLCDWRKGRSVPKAVKLLAIAKRFNVSVEYILTGQTGSTQPNLPEDLTNACRILTETPKIRKLVNTINDFPNEYIDCLQKIADCLAAKLAD